MNPQILSVLLAPALRAAGVPSHVVSLVDTLGPEIASKLWELYQRYEAGVPLTVLRAEAPDPIGALQKVDREDEL